MTISTSTTGTLVPAQGLHVLSDLGFDVAILPQVQLWQQGTSARSKWHTGHCKASRGNGFDQQLVREPVLALLSNKVCRNCVVADTDNARWRTVAALISGIEAVGQAKAGRAAQAAGDGLRATTITEAVHRSQAGISRDWLPESSHEPLLLLAQSLMTRAQNYRAGSLLLSDLERECTKALTEVRARLKTPDLPAGIAHDESAPAVTDDSPAEPVGGAALVVTWPALRYDLQRLLPEIVIFNRWARLLTDSWGDRSQFPLFVAPPALAALVDALEVASATVVNRRFLGPCSAYGRGANPDTLADAAHLLRGRLNTPKVSVIDYEVDRFVTALCAADA